MDADHEVLTDEEFAVEVKAKLRLVQELCRRGEVRAFKVGRDWRLTRAAVEEFKAQQRAAS